MAAVRALFGLPPVFAAATRAARAKIVDRAGAIGLDWAATLEELRRQDWEAALAATADPSISYPSYYTQPFHAYPQARDARGG